MADNKIIPELVAAIATELDAHGYYHQLSDSKRGTISYSRRSGETQQIELSVQTMTVATLRPQRLGKFALLRGSLTATKPATVKYIATFNPPLYVGKDEYYARMQASDRLALIRLIGHVVGPSFTPPIRS